MLVLTTVFGDTHPASADEMYTTTAQEASEMDTMEAMRNFVLNVKEHSEKLRADNEHAEFRAEMRTDDGVWKSGTTYIITVNTKTEGLRRTFEAGELVNFHAEHPAASNGSLKHIGIFQELITEVERAGGEARCIQDDSGKYGNHICAVRTVLTGGGGASIPVISVAGFHHELSEVDFSGVVCPDFTPQDFGEQAERGTDSKGEEFIRTSADMVHDEKSLENYLKTVDEHISGELAVYRAIPGLTPLQRRALMGQRFIQLRPCWRTWPWKQDDIYFYLITYAGEQYGIFNGLNPEFEDVPLRLYDGCIDISRGVSDIVDRQGDGFLEYYWSNPLRDDDLVVDENGDPIRGLSPGTSVKLGYFLETNFGGAAIIDYVLGSGIYPDKKYSAPDESGMCQPEPEGLSQLALDNLHKFPDFSEQEKGDGGCAIAPGTQGKVKAGALNLFLIAAALLLAVSGKSRLGGKFRTRHPGNRRAAKLEKD